MADNLQPAGIRAVIENLAEYLRGADQMNRATAGIGKAATDAAGQTQRAAGGVDQFGKSLDSAGKSSGGFTSAIGKVSDGVGGLALKLAPLGALIAGAFGVGKGVQALDDLGATIFRLQQTTNLTSEQASKLKFVFEESGVSAQLAERAIIKFSRALGGVADLEDGIAIPTGKGMADQLFQLGIRTEDATGKTRPLTEVLADLADQFQLLPDGVEKTTLATNLFGRNGKDLIPVLNQGRAGIEAMGEEAEKLGLVLNQTTTDAIRKNSLAQKEFHAALTGISVQIGLAVLPAMTLLITVGTKLAVAFNEKVVKGIQAASKVLNEFLSGVVKTLAPIIVAVIGAIEDGVESLAGTFKKAFDGAGLAASTLGTGKLRPLAVVVAYLGEAFRKSLIWITNIVKTFRIVSAVVGALIHDFSNMLRIFNFLPAPVQKILLVVAHLIIIFESIVGKVRDFSTALLGLLGGGPLGTVAGKVGDLAKGPMQDFLDVADRLGKFIVPALATAILGLMATLVIGTVVGFANAVGNMLIGFGNLGPLKLARSIIGDFIAGIKGTFKVAFDLAGNALEGLFNIGKGIANLAGKVFSFTLNLIGSAIDFIKGFAQGAFDELFKDKTVTKTIEAKGNIDPSAATILAEKDSTVTKTIKAQGEGGGEVTGLKPKADLISSILSPSLAGFEGGVAGVLGEGLLKRLGVFLAAIPALFVAAGATAGSAFDLAFAAAISPVGIAIGAALALAIVAALIYKFPDESKKVGKFLLSVIFPIALVPIAVAEFRGAIGKELGKLPEQLGKVVGGIGAAIAISLLLAFVGVFLAFKELGKLLTFLDKMSTAAGKKANEIGKKIGAKIIEGIVDGFGKVVDFGAFILGGLERLPGLIGGIIGKIVGGIPGFFEKLPGRITDAVKGIPKDLEFLFLKLPQIALDVALKIPGAFVGGLKSLPGLIGKLFTDGIPAAFVAVRTAIKNAATDAFGLLPGFIKDFLKLALDKIIDFGLGVFNEFKHVWETANEITGGALNRIRGDIQDKLSTIGDTIKRAFDTTLDIGTGIMGRIRDAAVGGWQFIVNGVTGVVGGLNDIVTGVFDHVADALVGSIAFVARKVADIINKVTDVLSRIGFGDNPFGLNSIRDALNAIGGSNLSGGTRQPGEPPAGGAVLPGLPGSGNPGFAQGTRRPLARATMAMVGEQGREIVYLPQGAMVAPNPVTEQLMQAAKKGRPPTAGPDGAFTYAQTEPAEGVNVGLLADLGDARTWPHEWLLAKLSAIALPLASVGHMLATKIPFIASDAFVPGNAAAAFFNGAIFGKTFVGIRPSIAGNGEVLTHELAHAFADFFHTGNELRTLGNQIVDASDPRAPSLGRLYPPEDERTFLGPFDLAFPTGIGPVIPDWASGLAGVAKQDLQHLPQSIIQQARVGVRMPKFVIDWMRDFIPLGAPAHLASGTSAPLSAATAAFVGERGAELALLGSGRAVLPAGSEVLSGGNTSRLLALLQGLPALAQATGGGDTNNYSLNMPVDARGLDFEQVRAVMHSELDRQLLNSRSRARRAGASLSSSIG